MFRLTIAVLFAAFALVAGPATAQELTGLPAQPAWDNADASLYTDITSSGSVNPLRITTQDISWDGSGSVDFNFNLNQRSRIWVAVYRTGSTETGARGPFGAWLRFVPQDLYVWSSSPTGADLEAGNNTITWDGSDFEGNAVGAGSYEFDIIGYNVLDESTVVGPSTRTGFADNVIDLRTNEIWVGEYDRDTPDRGHKIGDVIHAELGTDFIANPNAWERWDYNNVVSFEGARTLGGMRPDPDDPETFWTAHRSGEGAGVYKMTINRAAKSWDSNSDWADNGFAAVADPSIQMYQMEPWGNFLVNPNWSSADVPASSIEYFDKASGEVTKQLDVAEWYTNVGTDDEGNETLSAGGPGLISVDESGVWNAGWASTNIVKIDHDGNLIWVNRAGDLVGDRVTYEQAAETGLAVESSYPIRINADFSGNAAYFSPRHNSLGNLYSTVGRDGTGLFHIFIDPTVVGPLQPSLSTFMVLIQNDRSKTGGAPYLGPNAGSPGPWDGMYWDTNYSLTTHAFDRPEGKLEAGMLLHIPYDLASGSLGSGVTAVEEVGSAGTPDSYSLSSAYPNPFNPETTIEFAVPTDGFVKIDVFNTAGQLVTSLVDKDLSAGVFKTTWDAVDESGQQVSSGVYFYRMEAGDFSATHSMTLLK
jgi:hypothetical protein